MPAPFTADGVTGYLDRFGPALIDGWITIGAAPSPHPVIELVEDGAVVGRITATIWRTDLQEIRQGDGRWGFTAVPPAALADGRDHYVTLRLQDGPALLAGPVLARFHAGAHAQPVPRLRPPAYEPDVPVRGRPHGPRAPGMLISVIVVFYNMGREARRTLHALSRAYQRNIDGIAYEVIAIDNGSRDKLTAAFVQSFGPEFRLISLSPGAPSPVRAINEAARAASGQHIAVMIDGAHILTPGALAEAAASLLEAPRAVVGLRQWFIAGDQRFLSMHGYTPAMEDMIFDRIHWPADGYSLFRIGTPVWESPNHWFDGMSESNCLFVPRVVWDEIGGIDEAFDEPGAGYANLDLFRRAYEASGEPVVALLGEASFHQFHGGTTTNVEVDEKERRVRSYAHRYTQVRGKPWVPVDPGSIRLRGQLRTREALVSRQRPLSVARLGVTNAVRKADLPVHLDEYGCDYLISVYAEAGLADRIAWRGAALGIAASDAFAIADIIQTTRPERVLGINLSEGLTGFVTDALAGASNRLVRVGQSGPGGVDPSLPEIMAAIRRDMGAAASTLVLYAPRVEDSLPLATLHGLAEFVSLRGYLVVIGGAQGQPWLGYSRRWVMKAISSFVSVAPFAIDTTRTAHFVTACPNGFLQRIGPVLSGQDGGAGGVGRFLNEAASR